MSVQYKISPIKIIRQQRTYIMISCQFSKSFEIIIFSAHLHKICFATKIFYKKGKINLRFCCLLAYSYYTQCCLIKIHQESRRKKFWFRYSHFRTKIYFRYSRFTRSFGNHILAKVRVTVDQKLDKWQCHVINGKSVVGIVGVSKTLC